jgi:hypothetical protein
MNEFDHFPRPLDFKQDNPPPRIHDMPPAAHRPRWPSFLREISGEHCGSRTGLRHRTRLLVEVLERRIQPSTVTWTGAGGGDWATASNWSTGKLPGATDNVVIPALGSGAAIMHSTGDDTVASITSSTNLVLTGGNLTVNSTIQETSGTTLMVTLRPD